MPRLAGDISYRLLGGGQPTQACNRSNSFLANPQSKSHHNAAMFFDGINDVALIFGSQPMGYVNSFTHMVWCAPTDLSPSSDQTIYSIGQLNGPLNNGVDITIETGGVLSVSMYNSGGTLFKKRSIASEDTATPGVDGFFFGANSWHQIVVTWDGATLTVYRNGLNMNSYMTNVTDIGGSQVAANRAITAGNMFTPFGADRYEGFIHSHAHWNLPLGQDEISTIYNAGSGTDVDLNLGQGDYVNSNNLESWYRYGVTPSDSAIYNEAPTNSATIASTMTAAKIRRSAPEGSFYRKDAAGTIGETTNFLGVGNAHTVAAWVKTTSLPAEGVTRDVFRVTNGTSNNDQIALSLTTSGGVSYWEYEMSNAAGTYNVLTGTTPVVENQWYHILGCKQDTFSARFFVNGLDDLPPVIGGIVVQTNIGRSTHVGYDGRNFNPEQFEGDIHSVGVWSVPVSENGVRAIYSGGWKNLDIRIEHPCYSEAPYLTQWWVFGDPSASGTHPAGDTQYPNRAGGGYTMFTGMTGVGAEMRNRGIVETSLVGNCALFDDTSNIATSTALPLWFDNSFTISAWIKPEDLSSGQQYPLYIGPSQAAFSQNEIIWKIDADDPQEPLVVEVIGDSGVVLNRVSYGNLLLVSEWQHLCMVWDGVAISMYYNGGLVAGVVEASAAGSVSNTSRYIELGGSDHVLPASAGLEFEGKISHVGIWGVQLGTNEIRTVASQGHGLDLRYNKNDYQSGADLERYWKLGEDTFLVGRDFMNTMRGNLISPLTTVNGTVTVVGDAPGAESNVDGSIRSVLLDGTTQYYLHDTNTSLNIANAWTISLWAKSAASFPVGGAPRLLHCRTFSTGENEILIAMLSSGAMMLWVNDSASATLWLAYYDYVFTDNDWNHVSVTWDGIEFSVYINKYIQYPGTVVVDNLPGTMSNLFGRRVSFGSQTDGSLLWDGSLGHLAIWDVALNQANIGEIYDGNHVIDLAANFGNYIQSGDLQHYWRPGFADEGFDDESPIASPVVDLEDSVGISVNDIVVDAPPELVQGKDRSVSTDSGTYYLQTTDQTYQFGNAWSIGFWAKHPGSFPAPSQTLFEIGPTGTFNSGIFIAMDGLGQISFSTGKTGGAGLLWAGSWPAVLNSQNWTHLTFTWDGTNIYLYKNGGYWPGSTSFDGRPGVMADDLRSCGYGSWRTGAGVKWSGNLGHLGIWNTALVNTDCLEITAGGHAMDLRQDFGNYNNSANLVHYFRPGWNLGTNVGGGAGSGTNDESRIAFQAVKVRNFINSVGITDADVEEDAP